MGIEITKLINDIEQNIGDPEKTVEVKKDLDTIKLMLEPTSFHIAGVGSSSTYRLSGNYSDDKHRFLVKSIENLRDSLIERYLPTTIERTGTEEAKKAWALLFLHRILQSHDLGDPRIWNNRAYMRPPNNGLKDSIVFFEDGQHLQINEGYAIEFQNKNLSFHASTVEWSQVPDMLKNKTSEDLKEVKESYKVIASAQALPRLERKRSLKILTNQSTFLKNVHDWAEELEEEQKRQKEDKE